MDTIERKYMCTTESMQNFEVEIEIQDQVTTLHKRELQTQMLLLKVHRSSNKMAATTRRMSIGSGEDSEDDNLLEDNDHATYPNVQKATLN